MLNVPYYLSLILQINTISKIRYSAGQGHTILMCQTEEIHECFYELFNQHYRVVVDPEKGRQLYINISVGAHTKPCKVDPKFQCIVVIKKSDVDETPSPFLNRFEKFLISYDIVYKMVCDGLPVNLSKMINAVYQKVCIVACTLLFCHV